MIFQSTGYFEAHKPVEFEFEPGYTALIGPNGAGKTSLLLELKDYARQEGCPCLNYSNLAEGGPGAAGKAVFAGNVQLGSALMTSSEGECISINFGQFVSKIGQTIRENAGKGKPVLILLDALDSGSSIDRIREIRDLFTLVSEDAEKSGCEAYIIAASNAFGMVEGAECIDVKTGKHRRFATYDAYKNFILKAAEKMHNQGKGRRRP